LKGLCLHLIKKKKDSKSLKIFCNSKIKQLNEYHLNLAIELPPRKLRLRSQNYLDVNPKKKMIWQIFSKLQ
jgi:hypothetical protein